MTNTIEAWSWAIGIYAGSSPLSLSPALQPGHENNLNPVLTAADVTDLEASFVADPFMLPTPRGWVMFFEVLDAATGLGRIAWASSDDALRWRYRGLALVEPFHLSYPFVFEHRGEHYMVPETLAPGCVRLYRAEVFPDRWRHVADLVDGPAADPSLLHHDNRWWLFDCPRPYQHDCLRLHVADDLHGPWRPHPHSPIVDGDARLARPAGRPLAFDGRLFRFAQDCRDVYGAAVTAIEITRLDPETYADRPLALPLLGRGSSDPAAAWTRSGMHQVDAHMLAPGRWIACVDGNG
jgi:hypothetical protein